MLAVGVDVPVTDRVPPEDVLVGPLSVDVGYVCVELGVLTAVYVLEMLRVFSCDMVWDTDEVILFVIDTDALSSVGVIDRTADGVRVSVVVKYEDTDNGDCVSERVFVDVFDG
eukprot:PhM_4_TR3498/c0_g1_i1/m.66089